MFGTTYWSMLKLKMNKIVVIQYNFREMVVVGDDKIDNM